jgi:hypothetical protein
MISIKVIFSPETHGQFRERWGISRKVGNFEKGAVFRENGHLCEILREPSKRARLIQKKEFLPNKRL